MPLFSNSSKGPLFAWPGTNGTGSLSHAGLLQTGPIGYVTLAYGRGFTVAG